MIICLKLIAFAIWLSIMLALAAGGRRGTGRQYREVSLYIEDEDDLEVLLGRTFRRLHPRDRLIIYDGCISPSPRQSLVLSRLLHDNPSVGYCFVHQNCY